MKRTTVSDTLATVANKAALGEAVLDLVRNTGLLKPARRKRRAATDAAPKRKRNQPRRQRDEREREPRERDRDRDTRPAED